LPAAGREQEAVNCMYIVYAIKSIEYKRIYVGLTANLTRRLKEHNLGQVFSTKGFTPWKLIFQEKSTSRKEARKREKYWKSGIW
jgi:putative endonuclease